jgi:stage II sporulation protein AA (anti-sigma F factor antagonist)
LEEVRLSAEHREGSLIVAVGGELDVVTSRRFDEFLSSARREHDRVILDLSQVDFLDTSALAVIIGHWKKLSAAGGTLALAGARYRYTKTLWITGLADRLPMFATTAEALEAARPGDAVADGPRR